MWQAILPGQKLIPGDTIRYSPSSSASSHKDIIYEVVKTDIHYIEVIVKPGKDNSAEPADRKVIKYMDIGYHIALELWLAAASKN